MKKRKINVNKVKSKIISFMSILVQVTKVDRYQNN